MKEIALSQRGRNKGRYVALVDDEDYEYLNQFKWHATKGRTGGYYAARKYKEHNIWHTQKMHRLIMQTPDYLEVDHNDHNGLNNQKYNIINCTHSINEHNKKPRCKSGLKGVYYDHKLISARIKIDDKLVYLGSFKSETEAAKAFDTAAKLKYGVYAKLNYPNET